MKRALAKWGNDHLLQSGDAVLEGRVGAKKRAECAPAEERLNYAKRCRTRRDGGRTYAAIVRAKLFERADQALRMANHADAGFVGGIFAGAGQKELEKERSEGCKKDHQKS